VRVFSQFFFFTRTLVAEYQSRRAQLTRFPTDERGCFSVNTPSVVILPAVSIFSLRQLMATVEFRMPKNLPPP